MRTFSNKCILNNSKKIKSNDFFEPKKILNGVGKINFLNRNNIYKIFNKNFKIIYFEEITRSIENQKFLISEWIIYAKKHNKFHIIGSGFKAIYYKFKFKKKIP